MAMSLLQRHIFVCVNERAADNEKGCCASKGGKAVRAELKKQLAGRGLLGVVRANKSGCLDQCELGVALVVYPEQVWYRGVRVEDVEEIVERHILKGEYVERLLIPGLKPDASDEAKPLRLPTVDNPHP